MNQFLHRQTAATKRDQCVCSASAIVIDAELDQPSTTVDMFVNQLRANTHSIDVAASLCTTVVCVVAYMVCILNADHYLVTLRSSTMLKYKICRSLAHFCQSRVSQ